jgi:hypothetical protein
VLRRLRLLKGKEEKCEKIFHRCLFFYMDDWVPTKGRTRLINRVRICKKRSVRGLKIVGLIDNHAFPRIRVSPSVLHPLGFE